MQNVTPMSILIAAQQEQEEPAYFLLGGISGFVFYWLAFTVPFMIYGANTLFLLLYTWPFFLSLIPLSVLLGIIFSILLRGHVVFTLLLTGIAVLGLFWWVFSLLSGW